MGAFSFPKSSRLLRPRDYAKVFSDVQVRVPHRHFLILATPNDLGHARIGMVFSKRNIKLAVQRNRVKRVVRESFRQDKDLPALDIVLLARQGLPDQDSRQLRRIVDELWHRLKRKSAEPDTATATIPGGPNSHARKGTG